MTLCGERGGENAAAAAILADLDDTQREIAVALRGPVAVLAGAGTGKTRAITHRIAYGVHSGSYDPARVLAVTFTRKAATELQQRLAQLGAGGVNAQTFHAQALAQLGYFWPQFVGGEAPRLIGSKVTVLAQVAAAVGVHCGPETLRDLAAEIEWRKVSMLSIADYAERFAHRPQLAHLDAAQVLAIQQEYARVLAERKQIDFEDVLVLLSGMLAAEPRAALQVRERYRFFTIDEFQDVSPLQHKLLSLWLGERDDVCVVGDASQTIYSFAGATSEYLLNFRSAYPAAREFKLQRNYRSSPEIVHTANALMRKQPGAVELLPMRPKTGKVPRFEWFAAEEDEARAVAAALAAQIAAGLAPADAAVLYRTNAQSLLLEAALAEEGIPVKVHGAQRFFERADVRKAVLLIQAQAKVADSRPVFQVVSDLLRECGWSVKPPAAKHQRDSWAALQAIMQLLDQYPEGATLQQFARELQERQRAQQEPVVDAVTLCAVHAAKGLEWSIVHVIGLSEGTFPIAYARSQSELAEEQRLAYVAFTRARDVLLLSGVGARGRHAKGPSRFVVEAGVAR